MNNVFYSLEYKLILLFKSCIVEDVVLVNLKQIIFYYIKYFSCLINISKK